MFRTDGLGKPSSSRAIKLWVQGIRRQQRSPTSKGVGDSKQWEGYTETPRRNRSTCQTETAHAGSKIKPNPRINGSKQCEIAKSFSKKDPGGLVKRETMYGTRAAALSFPAA